MGNKLRQRTPPLTRRDALRRLVGGITGLVAAGCTPLRIVFHDYPEEFDADSERVDHILRAFATAVVPGIPTGDPTLTRVYYDQFYPLAKYRGFLAADLCARAGRGSGGARFETLPPEQRVAVIEEGLKADGTTARLYAGAVFLTQIACLSGIYDDEHGCSLIDFEGRYRPRSLSELTYADPSRYLAAAETVDGHPA